MIVTIIEGVDGTGKSTLAQGLARIIQGRNAIGHTRQPAPGEAARASYRNVVEGLNLMKDVDHVIFDRFHLGERVYGPLMRGADTLGDEGQREVEELLLAKHYVTLIRCRPPQTAAFAAWKERASRGGEYMTKRAQWLAAWDAYERLTSALPTVTWDFVNDTLNDLKERWDALHRG